MTLRDGTDLLIRPIQPEDATREREFIRGCHRRPFYFRFMMPVRELPAAMIERFTQIDYGRELALVGVVGEGLGRRSSVSRVSRRPPFRSAASLQSS